MRIEIKLILDTGKEYIKSLVVNQENLPDFDEDGRNSLSAQLYALIAALGRSIRQVTDVPFFVDIKTREDGSIVNCSFKIDKRRFDELKKLVDQLKSREVK